MSASFSVHSNTESMPGFHLRSESDSENTAENKCSSQSMRFSDDNRLLGGNSSAVVPYVGDKISATVSHQDGQVNL